MRCAMAVGAAFPDTIEFEGVKWHLLYCPGCPTMVVPNLSGSQIVGTTCDPVQIPGRDKPLFVSVVQILFPAQQTISGSISGERRLIAFRTYDYAVSDSRMIQPQDCVFYIAEPRTADSGSMAQRLYNALVGEQQKEAAAQEKADSSWCKQFEEVTKQSKHVQEQDHECEPGDGTH